MKRKSFFMFALTAMLISFTFVSCEKEKDDQDNEKVFSSLESPYLICASRNPGGVVFDFEYKDEKGGGNYLDSLTVDDFEYDIIVKTLKGEKPDGTLGGAPFIQLFENTVEAVNYSTVDNTCKGLYAFNNLTAANVQSYTVATDDASFDPSSLDAGNTGKPLMSDLTAELGKLVIGMRWKSASNNDIADDEPVWIIRTREGKLVKLIVTDFPADPAPSATGYVALFWDFLD